MGDEVSRVRRGRQVAALDLVLALGARLDARDAVLDREFDGAVVAQLEVKEGDLLAAPQLRP
jgi:hypothetical protein